MFKLIDNKSKTKIDFFKCVELLLRIAVFLTFLGHGIVALIGNQQWSIYLKTAGLPGRFAIDIMFYIGILDVVVAIIIAFKPYKYVVLWAFIWAFSTALIRPISGESIWAFVERGSNWMVPFVLYIMITKKEEYHKRSNL